MPAVVDRCSYLSLSLDYLNILYDQLYGYLINNSLLYEFQSAFRSSYYAETCLTHLSNYIKLRYDKGNCTGMILALQQALDTVKRKILLSTLKCVGLNENSTCWFQLCLTGM